MLELPPWQALKHLILCMGLRGGTEDGAGILWTLEMVSQKALMHEVLD